MQVMKKMKIRERVKTSDTKTLFTGHPKSAGERKTNAYAVDAQAGSQFNSSVMGGLKVRKREREREDTTSDGNEDVPSNLHLRPQSMSREQF